MGFCKYVYIKKRDYVIIPLLNAQQNICYKSIDFRVSFYIYQNVQV